MAETVRRHDLTLLGSSGDLTLELEANRAYRFVGKSGQNSRNGVWAAKGDTISFDEGKACPYTLGRI